MVEVGRNKRVHDGVMVVDIGKGEAHEPSHFHPRPGGIRQQTSLGLGFFRSNSADRVPAWLHYAQEAFQSALTKSLIRRAWPGRTPRIQIDVEVRKANSRGDVVA